MKQIFNNLGIFVLVTLAFSGLSGCGGSGANTDSPPAANRSAEYPPLASGLAQADFELLDGTKFKISDHKGKVLLLNIWGTWCGPCRAEMPHLVELKDKYASQGFEIIGINVGNGSGQPEPLELIQPFVEKMGLNYAVTKSSQTAMMEFYKITKQDAVPQTFLVDRAGHMRGRFIGANRKELESMKEHVAKVLAEG
jgi:thiol-disulfide isomerase/thioredoxin